MIADLVLTSLDFHRSFDEKGRSVRQATNRGINLPDIMTVQNQDYVDSGTKLPGRRFTVRFDRWNVNASTGERYMTSAYVVYAIPLAADGSDSAAVVATLKACLNETSEGIIARVLNSEL